MTRPPPIARRHARQQLVLKVEYDDAAGFRSNYLTDLSEGGVRIHSQMEVGQRILLNISFLGFVEPIQIEAVVQWSQPSSHPEGAASGLAFVDPSPEAASWLFDVLDASTQLFLPTPAEEPSRVLLLEAQPFLREIYGQEVRNWAELRDEEPLELVALADPAAWLDAVTRIPATLGIIDIDDLPDVALELYRRVRANSISADLPLIVLGAPVNIDAFSTLSDDLLFCLRKPLRFGVLMNTVRMLAHKD
ncbi:MAG: PilZ domain-containing protein [Deltaproteobacteria bacterium]|nr:PilZ domain-containing protein [Deltaproteobacteria bacterium]